MLWVLFSPKLFSRINSHWGFLFQTSIWSPLAVAEWSCYVGSCSGAVCCIPFHILIGMTSREYEKSWCGCLGKQSDGRISLGWHLGTNRLPWLTAEMRNCVASQGAEEAWVKPGIGASELLPQKTDNWEEPPSSKTVDRADPSMAEIG